MLRPLPCGLVRSMDKVANLPLLSRNALFSETANAMRTTPAIIEKDFWVVWVLSKIFAQPHLTALARDFAAMQTMIFDLPLTFDEIMRILGALELEINALKLPQHPIRNDT